VRDYPREDVCDVDPKLLVQEFDVMNQLLAEFLQGTSAGVDGFWADEHIEMLEQGQKSFPGLLDIHERNLTEANKCSADNYGEASRRGLELSRQARRRLEDAPEVLSWARARRDIAKWKEAQPAARETAREQWCPPKPKAGKFPDIYYAFQDDEGRTQWLFCDGSKVTASANAADPLEFVLPPADPQRRSAKSFGSRPYIDAAQKYPRNEIVRAPRLPEKKKEAPPAAEDDDLGS
jgi:hypothetical protein